MATTLPFHQFYLAIRLAKCLALLVLTMANNAVEMEMHNSLEFYQQSFETKYLELIKEYYHSEIDSIITQITDINDFIFIVTVGN
jgi:hypothetical protein